MFTGIIETTGSIKDIFSTGTNKTFWIASLLSDELKVDQSLSHNGVCLTVEEIKKGLHRITAIEETLLKTNLNNWKINDVVNIERCMQMNGRLDGHIVQGHVDTVATCIEVLTGRINVRNGAALGYNPTDFFRSGALRSVVSIDPNSLRENRLGTVMLRPTAHRPIGCVFLRIPATDKPTRTSR